MIEIAFGIIIIFGGIAYGTHHFLKKLYKKFDHNINHKGNDIDYISIKYKKRIDNDGNNTIENLFIPSYNLDEDVKLFLKNGLTTLSIYIGDVENCYIIHINPIKKIDKNLVDIEKITVNDLNKILNNPENGKKDIE